MPSLKSKTKQRTTTNHHKEEVHTMDNNNVTIDPDDSNPMPAASSTSPVSVKDLCVLVTLATTLSTCLVTFIFGWDVLMERCVSLDLTSVLVTLVACVFIIAALTYVLLRVTAQYLVYVGLGVLLAIVYPCHPSRVLPFINKLFTRAKEKQQGQKQL